jgi:hypothetical protein
LYNLMKCRALKVQNRNQKHNNFLHLERWLQMLVRS